MAAWRNAGYHEMPEYVAFKQLLQAPVEDAQVPEHGDPARGSVDEWTD